MHLFQTFSEIFIFAVIIFLVLRFMEGTIGQGLMRGSLILFLSSYGLLYFVTLTFQLPHVKFFLENVAGVFVIAMIIIFHPEIRNALVSLGRFRLLSQTTEGENTAAQLLAALNYLSNARIGALIAIEGDIGLGNWIEKGVRIEGIVSKELLCTLFWPGTNLHDGAVIISNHGQLAAAMCLFPISETMDLDSTLGTRHRAALGLSERTDALIFVVSEETGIISIASRGKLRRSLSTEVLLKEIENFFTRNNSARQNQRRKKNEDL